MGSNVGRGKPSSGIVDAVWDEALAGHTAVGTSGERMGRIPNAAAGANGGLPTVDANNRVAGIQGTKNDFDDLNDLSAANVQTQCDASVAKVATCTTNKITDTVVGRVDAAISTRSTLTQAQILSDATPFAGANINQSLSTTESNIRGGTESLETLHGDIGDKGVGIDVISRLPNASPTGAGGLPTVDASNRVAGVSGSVAGNVDGSVGSVVGAVGSVTGNVSGNVTGSVGSVVGHTPQTGDNFARLGAPVGVSVSADIASVKTSVGTVTGNVNGSVASVTGNVGGDILGQVAGVAGNVNGTVLGNVNGTVGGISGSVPSFDALQAPDDVGTPLAVSPLNISSLIQVTGTISVTTAGLYRVRVLLKNSTDVNGLTGGAYTIVVRNTAIALAAPREHAYDNTIQVVPAMSLERISDIMWFPANSTIAVFVQGQATDTAVSAEVHIYRGV